MDASTAAAADPLAVYTERLAARVAALEAARARIAQISNFRLLVAAAFVGVLIAVYAVPVSGLWLLLPTAAFVALLVVNGRVSAAEQHAERGVAFYEDGIRRVTDAWAGTGRTGEAYLPEEHLYGLDLDLVGRGSLFERINRARTALGERRLVRWLAAPAAPEVIRDRQAAVAELAPDLDFREDLAVVAREVRTAIDREHLGPWARAPRRLSGRGFRSVMLLLAGVTVTLLVLGLAGAHRTDDAERLTRGHAEAHVLEDHALRSIEPTFALRAFGLVERPTEMWKRPRVRELHREITDLDRAARDDDRRCRLRRPPRLSVGEHDLEIQELTDALERDRAALQGAQHEAECPRRRREHAHVQHHGDHGTDREGPVDDPRRPDGEHGERAQRGEKRHRSRQPGTRTREFDHAVGVRMALPRERIPLGLLDDEALHDRVATETLVDLGAELPETLLGGP